MRKRKAARRYRAELPPGLAALAKCNRVTLPGVLAGLSDEELAAGAREYQEIHVVGDSLWRRFLVKLEIEREQHRRASAARQQQLVISIREVEPN